MTFQLRPGLLCHTEGVKILKIGYWHSIVLHAAPDYIHIKAGIVGYQREARVLCQERGNDCVPDLRELRLVPYIIIADVMDILCPFWDKIHLSRADKRIDACIFLAVDKPYQPN